MKLNSGNSDICWRGLDLSSMRGTCGGIHLLLLRLDLFQFRHHTCRDPNPQQGIALSVTTEMHLLLFLCREHPKHEESDITITAAPTAKRNDNAARHGSCEHVAS